MKVYVGSNPYSLMIKDSTLESNYTPLYLVPPLQNEECSDIYLVFGYVEALAVIVTVKKKLRLRCGSIVYRLANTHEVKGSFPITTQIHKKGILDRVCVSTVL